MKRKAKDSGDTSRESNEDHRKKRATETEEDEIRNRFRPGLFDAATVQSYAENYAHSTPYLHSVVSHLMNDDLLRSVRQEILENIHFTPKETDIYKIHQSGDLANLDGLPASALEKLPSLLKLRDALYGEEFRSWVSAVSGAGPLSGTKTDMAVNVYVPGCHLLCHDDVIGTRRVSYILYLTNPDVPWKAEWGGALRLYPTDEVQGEEGDGKTYKLPRAEWTKVIPPAWNQLSFFTVQPGESFHDVEEVYHRAAGEDEEDDGGRVRMAISGWFHIPQEGEDGFEPGLEEKLAERSSLQQLQGKADQFDEPQQQWQVPTGETAMATEDDDEPELTEEDLAFLIKYMTPNYLTPDTVEELTELFTEECLLQLTNFLSEKFSAKLKTSLENGDAEKLPWATSRPPHKHRYQYLHAQPHSDESASPLRQVLDELLPSSAFQKWLALVTGSKLKRCSVMARRFRQGLDYQLAQGYAGEQPQLEYTLCVTPSIGWGGEDEEEKEETEEQNGNSKKKSKKKKGKKTEEVVEEEEEKEKDNPGGYELYMAGEDSDSDSDSDEDNDGVPIPPTITTNSNTSSNTNNPHQQQSTTGAGPRRSSTKTKTKKHQKSDPAIYNSANSEEDDGILFSNPAAWNTLSLVLRDRGTLKFVKFVSKNAPGDRLDFVGGVEVDEADDDDE